MGIYNFCYTVYLLYNLRMLSQPLPIIAGLYECSKAGQICVFILIKLRILKFTTQMILHNLHK